MMVNPYVDGHTEILNTSQNAKNNNLLKTKRIPNTKYKLSDGKVFTF